uniref:Uncharacterized protein n=1 Tax=Pyricularia oryzae (strain P131) TaxID=1143193 RepID=L7IS87_PYRO1
MEVVFGSLQYYYHNIVVLGFSTSVDISMTPRGSHHSPPRVATLG